MFAHIYTHSKQPVHTKLARELLEEEGVPYQLHVVSPPEMIRRSRGTMPFGWIVEIDNKPGAATNWKELYLLLEEHDMFSKF